MKEPVRGVKIGRNDPCPCGSGKKYKKCCLSLNPQARPEFHPDNIRIKIKSNTDIEGIRRAGMLVLETLDLVEEHLQAGLPTDAINALVHEFTIKNKGIPEINRNPFIFF